MCSFPFANDFANSKHTTSPKHDNKQLYVQFFIILSQLFNGNFIIIGKINKKNIYLKKPII